MQIEEIRERLTPLETSCLCDAKKMLRCLDPAIRPLSLGLKLVGRAFTVSCCNDFLTVINPTTPLSSALRFSALTMREIRLVIAPLDPGHKGEALLNRIRMQGQHDFE